MLTIDVDAYESMLRGVARFSPLYSDSETPFLNSRFIEKLYVHTSKSRDLSRKDMSFDAISFDGFGIGIKTFAVRNFTSVQSEKIAEFSAHARMGEFSDLSDIDTARKVATFRNSRVQSDARTYEIDLSQSIYHCLVRAPSACMVHEEKFELINIDSISLSRDQSNQGGHIHFNDEKCQYIFNVSKNTLYKKFDLNDGANSRVFEVHQESEGFLGKLESEFGLQLMSMAQDLQPDLQRTIRGEMDYVILPLYSSRSREVPERSGINQWNALGRDRKFGEAYISIPAKVRRAQPDFFPEREVPFKLKLPSESVIEVKTCQQDAKALMSNPNHLLCDWLFRLIDESEWTSRKRVIEHRPYTYADLLRIGIDSVKISLASSDKSRYSLEQLPLGSYESFISKL
jgi:hypothetical protein